MRQLVLSYVQISSIERLKPQPQLETFTADSSQISTFKNFMSIGSVRKLSLRNTPVSREPSFALSALIICPNLVTLNGQVVSSLVKRRAANYPSLGRVLVNAGWLAQFPYPSEDRLYELAAKFGVASATTSVREEEEDDIDHDFDRFDEVLGNLWRRHDRLVGRALRRCGFPTSEVSEEEEKGGREEEDDDTTGRGSGSDALADSGQDLLRRIAGILKDHDLPVDEADLSESVLDAVDKLCADSNEALDPDVIEK
jgi:hypothetical protein